MHFEVTEEIQDESKKYKCKECLYSVNKHWEIVQHKLRHKYIDKVKNENLFFFCPNCEEPFKNLFLMQNHDRDKHGEEFCKICNKKVKILRSHLEKFHPVGVENACPVCGYNENGDKKWDYFKKHLKNAKMFHIKECEHCGEELNTWADKKKHMVEKHDNVWLYRCGDCGLIFENKTLREIHKKKEHFGKNVYHFECDICHLNFKDNGTLKFHKDVKHKVEPVNCPDCGKTFPNSILLTRHKKGVHRTIACELCGKLISYQQYKGHKLNNHSDYNERVFACKVCPKRFTNSEHLKNHETIHTGERPYKCGICPDTFNNPSNMYHHRKSVHLGIKRKYK